MKNVLVLIFLMFLATGCATQPKKDYTKFYSADPHSVLVIPVVNKSVNVDAPNYFLSTISIPLAEQGYYVFPVNMIKRVLEDDGLSDADLVHNAPTQKLASLFDADSVLYITIQRWDARYFILSTTVTVAIEYVLKDGKTGDPLWHDFRTVQYSPQANSSGNPIADLIVQAAVSAMERAAPNYLPLAKQANGIAFKFPGPGIPPGPYAKREEKPKVMTVQK
jgi:hypothetical protein